ncbi:MAG TPA: DUF3488 and transglutaminase-like domain-containing protein, partial [Ornithinimicrobium sp.]|uniref:transglutaminase family protein n=1 Tax=Ornithinimicrobium sp. TaxID=1977084 RepID=UPI002B46D666
MNLQRGMWPEALVAALASLSVGWPLTTLLQEQTWIADGVVMVALVALLGAVLRSLNTLPSLVAVAQLVAGTWVLCWMYLAPTLSFGLPTPSTVTRGVDLLAEAGTVLRQFAAPAPTTTAVAFLVVSVLLLTAVAVDSIGVTNGAPAIAGVPLAAAFLVSVSNNGEPMQPWFFLATASLWLIMVAQQSDRLLAAWPRADLREFGTGTRFGRGYRNLARGLGALALTGALVTAAILPHMPPTFLGQGLARNAGANNLSGGSQVTFTESMDPGEDLRNQSDAPVLEYTSTTPSVPPFRVSAASDFQGERWQTPERDGQQLQGPTLPQPVGLSSSAVVASQEVSITVNTLEAPHLALPVGAVRASVGSPMLQVSEDSGAVLVQSPVDSYSATYEEIAADATPDAVGPSAQTLAEQDPRLVRVPEASAPAVQAGAEQIVGAATEPLTIGRRLQEHFRSPSYTYSLDLAAEDPDAAEDPISQFLATRRGYCVQFATAMVMMARSQGIPARMAVGFLPGEVGDDAWTVVASDAHTWPELYIDGLGWTRFEPTPGIRTGAPPELTRSDALPTAPEQAPEVPETEPQDDDSQTGSQNADSTR